MSKSEKQEISDAIVDHAFRNFRTMHIKIAPSVTIEFGPKDLEYNG